MTDDQTQLMTAEAVQSLQTMSAMLDRWLFANRAGLQFDGDRNVYGALGYRQNLTFQDYQAKYDRDPIAARVIDAPAAATWRNQPTVTDDEDPERTTPFEEAWMSLEKRLRVYQRLERLDRMTGIGEYGALLIGFRGQPLADQEATRVAGPDDVLFLAPYNECSAQIDVYDGDPQSERFGLPSIYTLQINAEGRRTQQPGSLRAHHSRIIHVVENALEDDVFGRPRLRNLFNLLDDALKVVGGSAETYWLEARRGLHANIDKDAKPLPPNEQSELKDQIDEYVNNLRRVIRTQGMELNTLGGAVANPQGPFDVIMKLVSVASGIPIRILTGSERGELASSQDEGNWAGRIEERQIHFAEPIILRPLIDRLISFGALPEPSEGEYEINWQSLSDPGERENAETAEILSRAAVNFQAANRIMTPDEGRERLGLEGPAPAVEDSGGTGDRDAVEPGTAGNDEGG